MIKAVKIKNFKVFEDLHLSEFSRITLLGGRNNVGKSTLLEAMFLFYDSNNPGLFFRHLGWRGADVTNANAETLIAPSFRDFQMDRTISIEIAEGIYQGKMEATFDFSNLQTSIDVDMAENDKRNLLLQPTQNFSTSYALNVIYKFDAMRDWKRKLVVKLTPPTEVNVQFERITDFTLPSSVMKSVVMLGAGAGTRTLVNSIEDTVRFGELDIEGKIDRVVQFLKIIEPNLKGLSAIPFFGRSVIYADIGLSRKMPITSMGDGVNKLLSIILAIGATKDGFVFIDEVDSGIHYSIMPELWEGIGKASKEFNCQVIATTHSYECLQAAYQGVANADITREFSYIRLDRVNKKTIAKSYSYTVLGAALQNGWEVR